jgi:hypothetical protein
MMLDGPMDGVAFVAWIEQMLAPALSAGMTVVIDNLPAHKLNAVRALIEARGPQQGDACQHEPRVVDRQRQRSGFNSGSSHLLHFGSGYRICLLQWEAGPCKCRWIRASRHLPSASP